MGSILVRVRIRVIGIEGKIPYFTFYFVILERKHRGHHPPKQPLKIPYGTIAVKDKAFEHTIQSYS